LILTVQVAASAMEPPCKARMQLVRLTALYSGALARGLDPNE
jgi:hypothetical protein